MSSENENSESKKSLVWLYSGLGVVLSFLILLILNLIVSTSVPFKLDLTEDKVYTLSAGTKKILNDLDTTVTMSFFVSKDKDEILEPFIIGTEPYNKDNIKKLDNLSTINNNSISGTGSLLIN